MRDHLARHTLPRVDTLIDHFDLMDGVMEHCFASPDSNPKTSTIKSTSLQDTSFVASNASSSFNAFTPQATISGETTAQATPLGSDSNIPEESNWTILEDFTLFPKLPLILRTSVIRMALPPPATISLKHRTSSPKFPNDPEISVHMMVESNRTLTLANFGSSRALALLRVNKDFKDEYIDAMPLSIPIGQANGQRVHGKLRFSNADLLYCRSLLGTRIAVDRTFEGLAQQDIFKGVTRIALRSVAVVELRLSSRLKDFFKIFPRLEHLMLLGPFITRDLDDLLLMMQAEPDVVSRIAFVPQFRYLRDSAT